LQASVSLKSLSGDLRTRISESSGAHREIGSVKAIRTSSASMRAATEVIGFVIEAIRKIVSRSMGTPSSTSRQPRARYLRAAVERDKSGSARDLTCLDGILQHILEWFSRLTQAILPPEKACPSIADHV